MASDPKTFRESLLRLNLELLRAEPAETAAKIASAREVLLSLLEANQQPTIEALEDLLVQLQLSFRDPLVEVAFDTAGDCPALVSLAADVVRTEAELLRGRTRALEARLMRSSHSGVTGWGGLDLEEVLRFFNEVLDSWERELESSSERDNRLWAQFERAIGRLGEVVGSCLNAMRHDRAAMDAHGSFLAACRNVLALIRDVVRRFASGATSRGLTRSVLRLLQANTPLPAWHPAAAGLVERRRVLHANKEFPLGGDNGGWSGGGAMPSLSHDAKARLALALDKAIEMLLGMLSRAWERPAGTRPARSERPKTWRSTSDASLLESVLLDPGQAPKVRAMAAALLRVLTYAVSPSPLSPRTALYCDLFLIPYEWTPRPGKFDLHRRAVSLASGEEIDVLVSALEDASDYLRRNAAVACYSAAQDHPEWFRRKHYARLLPVLRDPHHGIRAAMRGTFQRLGRFRNHEISRIIHDVATGLEDASNGGEDKSDARKDLELAVDVTLDRFWEDLEKLEQEVQRLEARRRQLLAHIEQQEVRIGEEIHHEVLNTRCAYLATAIDESDYAEAQTQLDALVRDLRRIMNNHYPSDLETEGFLATIRRRLEDAGMRMRRYDRAAVVEFDCPSEVTDAVIVRSLREPAHIVLLYRIVLEAVINARKHARGTRIAVVVRSPRPGAVEIAVRDNGRGDGGPFVESRGTGLMFRRAEEIGAELAYRRTSPEGGTTVVIRVMREPGGQTGAGEGGGDQPMPGSDE
ncbi:MAG: hypothetical protein HY726_23045 [Candidatus Rokubacteria bacterium]|nr:hypothetical protein [Candidatus Rokubacteria bacterium]